MAQKIGEQMFEILLCVILLVTVSKGCHDNNCCNTVCMIQDAEAVCCKESQGRMRFQPKYKFLEICDGTEWLQIDLKPPLGSKANPGTSYQHILNKKENKGCHDNNCCNTVCMIQDAEAVCCKESQERMRFQPKYKLLEIGDGTEWLQIDLKPPLGSKENPGTSCQHILNKMKNKASAKDGIYWIKFGGAVMPVYCDMRSDGGGNARVNFTLLGLVVGFSFIIILLFVVVAFLCWKVKKQQKEENGAASRLPSSSGQNDSTTEGSNSFTQNNLEQNENPSPPPLPPESSAQTQNSDYDEQLYMELRIRGQRSSDGYDYAIYPYEVTH